MMRAATHLGTVCALAFLVSSASAQQAMLSPPDNHYFVSKGSWGQDHPDQWALQRIGFDASPQSAWRLVKANAQPVIVAVIDTGLDWAHRNISVDNLWHNTGEIDGNRSDDDKNGFVDDIIGWNFPERTNKPWDFDGHGTMTAGIIASSWKDKDGIAGVNPFTKLMILKAVNNFGHTRLFTIAQAIKYAADNGARVINLSVGGEGKNAIIQAAIDYAYARNAVIVAAAGNEDKDVSKSGLAGSDKILTVGATGLDDQKAVFSNWGNISVVAPGVDVLSLRAMRTDLILSVEGAKYTASAAFVGDDKRYYRASGTSFAAPLVSGLASLMIANDPSLTNEQVIAIIKSTARDVGTPGVDQFTGYGIVDARAALSAPKDYFLYARIKRVEVVQKGGAQAVRVFGSADANALKAARVEIGAGENPRSWKAVGTPKKTAGPEGVLAEIPATNFAGSPVWQIRVVATHNSGATREARFRLKLG
jgi:subtilisin family serine protease